MLNSSVEFIGLKKSFPLIEERGIGDFVRDNEWCVEGDAPSTEHGKGKSKEEEALPAVIRTDPITKNNCACERGRTGPFLMQS